MGKADDGPASQVLRVDSIPSVIQHGHSEESRGTFVTPQNKGAYADGPVVHAKHLIYTMIIVSGSTHQCFDARIQLMMAFAANHAGAPHRCPRLRCGAYEVLLSYGG